MKKQLLLMGIGAFIMGMFFTIPGPLAWAAYTLGLVIILVATA